MKLPNFEKFSATLGESAYKEIAETVNNSKITIEGSGTEDIVKSAPQQQRA